MRIRAAGGNLATSKIEVPGDKSISHRSIILGSLATGQTRVRRCLMGADVVSTIGCFRELGVLIAVDDSEVLIEGVGLSGLRAPLRDLDAGNAGTCMRLLSGVLAGQPFESTLVGDASLSRRPMRRVIDPLQQMGAKIEASPTGTAPLRVLGRRPLKAIQYTLPVASAQIKSAVLLAGLFADGQSTVVEPEPVRDHTERMLAAFGGNVGRVGNAIHLAPSELRGTSIDVPGDISSAAFLIVAGLLSKDCCLRIERVGLNPLRCGVIDILRQMGGRIDIENQSTLGGEPVGDIIVRSSSLRGIDVDPRLVSSAIDEFPIIFVAAAFAEGVTVITGAAELRVKESDRIAAMVDGLVLIGATARATDDGAVIQGTPAVAGGCTIESHYDHRIAMAFAIASLRCQDEVVVNEADAIDTSFPGFLQLCSGLGLSLTADRSAIN